MADASLRIGRGIADITGQPWGVGMMGYGMPDQWTNGLLSRQYARAFVFEDAGDAVVFVVADIGMFFQAGVEAILARLAERFGDRYTARNVVLTATHTHCGPGGHGHHMLYNVTTKGFHRRTFDRLVDGTVAAIEQAHADLADSTAVLTRGELRDASANRARAAFERNPAEEKALFPDGIDPTTTVLRIERDGRMVGAINWFGVHNTSMTNRNRLISADNKGLAAWSWEQEGDLVTAFAQTNAGDLSPNLDLSPGQGPTSDERENTRIIAERQLAAARRLAAEPGTDLGRGVAAVATYVDFSRHTGAAGATGPAVLGASFAAGKLTDGAGSPLFDEGKANPVPQRISDFLYRRSARLAAVQAPKDLLIPIGPMRWSQQVLPVQLVRLGSVHLVCLPFEVTVVAGLRIRRAVAARLGVELDAVLCQGYANGYAHYVTTPEEYDEQLYEGGSTVFGKHQLGAIVDAVDDLAGHLAAGTTPAAGPAVPRHRIRIPSPFGSPKLARRRPVAVRRAPRTARVGDVVEVHLDADHPNRHLRPAYFVIQRRGADGTWTRIADDASPSTTITWHRRRLLWSAVITWQPAEPGEYRIRYLAAGSTTTDPIRVTGGAGHPARS
ncbi:neutral/alkaline non-lysosomal ceramidase N-terminal domain-containing protein [Nocardioides sp. AE5]|uniref:neutral/alkaline non-lysosomal ceramidase N-terminal domain-containing protein n=1 Tax=Nocardioides sp. AE5 TaxID=2962573 RepID=UPI002880D5A7|nr:neutral/alkaline non-lysosomal ceramidase N-terminal domain-containing protein [Nocardioides sp. AE5]MDT0201487.1 neutral/alkaline non-lysosomal ceramidase N-terminal domain-containing protein [Nocardioides sp. AE5]